MQELDKLFVTIDNPPQPSKRVAKKAQREQEDKQDKPRNEVEYIDDEDEDEQEEEKEDEGSGDDYIDDQAAEAPRRRINIEKPKTLHSDAKISGTA